MINSTSMNSFKEADTKRRYLLKLAPDFSTLDIAERFMIENNFTDSNLGLASREQTGLFYYKENTTVVKTTYKRAIFKLAGTTETSIIKEFINENDEPTEVIFDTYICNGDIYLIVLNEDGIAFKLERATTVVGVCF